MKMNKFSNPVVLVLAASILALALAMLVAKPTIQAATIKQFPLRQFYVTSQTVVGADALNACASGYHMASMWEILDVSNLRYNISLGDKTDDSGSSAPVGHPGWIRTGNVSSGVAAAGQANCNVWTSNSEAEWGSTVFLNFDWTLPPTWDGVLNPWVPNYINCSIQERVWCVQD